MSKETKVRRPSMRQKEFAGMPTGAVPADIRELAEAVVQAEVDIAHLKQEVKKDKSNLMDKMLHQKIQIAVVVVGKWKYRIRMKTGTVGLKIEDIGVDEKQ